MVSLFGARLVGHGAVPGFLYDFFSLMDTCPHGVNLMLIYAYLLSFFLINAVAFISQ